MITASDFLLSYEYFTNLSYTWAEAIICRCYIIDVLQNFVKLIRRRLFRNISFNKVASLNPRTLKNTPAQVLSCEFCKFYKIQENFFSKPLWTIAPEEKPSHFLTISSFLKKKDINENYPLAKVFQNTEKYTLFLARIFLLRYTSGKISVH